jgi:Fe(3+) dicitrate transport protein
LTVIGRLRIITNMKFIFILILAGTACATAEATPPPVDSATAAPAPSSPDGPRLGPAATATAPAPSTASAVAAGIVEDPSGAPVPGALVTLRRSGLGYLASVRAEADGRFRLEAPEADYEITAAAPGFSVTRASLHLLASAGEVRLVLRPGTFTEEVTVIGTRLAGSAETIGRTPGSVETIDSAELEASRVLNVNETLRKASGINVRDEEGFALRPNIGIRGLNPTRSTKVLLLEDGLFVTYAPYGDNASYYHPPIERFDTVEVVKGSGQIAYGPVTVGGVINYLTPAPPARPAANLRLVGGSRDYFNGQGTAGGTFGRTALLGEYMRKQGDGARDNVHSAVDDANLKAVFTLSPTQTLTVKGNYYGEDSQVTYSGLTLAEWTADPRSNAFSNDGFDGRRLGGSLKHQALFAGALLTTHLYASSFSRDWWRQSSNSAQRPNDRADPSCGGMENLHTTCGNEGRLRDFTHFGVEPRLRVPVRLLGAQHEAELGVRAHFETQERLQVNGDTPLARTGVTVEDNRRENEAYSAFLQDRVLLGDFTLSGGVRLERIFYERTNRLANGGAGASGATDITEWVPGVGLSYAPGERLNLFAGLHRGFAPPRTEDVISNSGGVVELDSEKSWNYELGVRALPVAGLRLEATLFRNDYANQVVAASLAGGVGATLTNGGETLHQGLELGAQLDSAALTGSSHNVYVRASFTALPVARFEGTRTSSVAGSGSVSVSGNRLPYAPESMLTAAVGYRHPRGFTAQLESVYVSEQYTDDLNTVASTADGQRGLVPSYTIWNLALSYDFRRLSLYVTAKNLLDELYLADRSRGMVPGPPRLVQAGIATRF